MDNNTKKTLTILGVGVVAFLGVRYLMRNRNENEQKSNFRGSRLGGQRAMISIQGRYAVCNKTGASLDIHAPSTNADTINAFRADCEAAGGTVMTTNYLPHGARIV